MSLTRRIRRRLQRSRLLAKRHRKAHLEPLEPRILLSNDPLSYTVAAGTAIILDVDNGPSWLVHDQNARLYTDEALATWSSLLVPKGVLAVWSAQMEPEFMDRMKRHFRDVEETTVLLPDTKGRPRNDYVYRGIRY